MRVRVQVCSASASCPLKGVEAEAGKAREESNVNTADSTPLLQGACVRVCVCVCSCVAGIVTIVLVKDIVVQFCFLV